MFPHRSSAAPTGPHLLMADGRQTKAWGSRLIPLQFGSRRFQFQFLLTAVDQPILGADFLAEVDFLVDTNNPQVLQGPSFEPLATPRFSPADSSTASVCKLSPDVASLLDEFPEAWNPRTPGKLPEHNIEHVIETEGQPLYTRPHRLDQVKLAQAKAEFQKLESPGIIRRSDSPWASPLHMVQKSDGSWRPCSDYRRLNNLRVVLELLVQNGLVLNLDKCSFVQHEIEYLGHKITVDGIVPHTPSCRCPTPPTTSPGCTWSPEVPRHDQLLLPFFYLGLQELSALSLMP